MLIELEHVERESITDINVPDIDGNALLYFLKQCGNLKNRDTHVINFHVPGKPVRMITVHVESVKNGSLSRADAARAAPLLQEATD